MLFCALPSAPRSNSKRIASILFSLAAKRKAVSPYAVNNKFSLRDAHLIVLQLQWKVPIQQIYQYRLIASDCGGHQRVHAARIGDGVEIKLPQRE